MEGNNLQKKWWVNQLQQVTTSAEGIHDTFKGNASLQYEVIHDRCMNRFIHNVSTLLTQVITKKSQNEQIHGS